MSMTSKNCTSCKELKPLFEFYDDSRTRDGKASHCKSCYCNAAKSYKRSKEGLITQIYSIQKVSSKRRGHIMPLYTKNEFRNWMLNQKNFNDLYSAWIKSGHESMLRPSCDRLDDYKPYSLDNIRLVTWGENKAKGSLDRILGINTKWAKPVIRMDLFGNFISRHCSVMQAERDTGIKNCNIHQCCRGKVKHSGGFLWMFAIN